MGQSTDAILFWGILVDQDECECPWSYSEDMEWEGVYAQRKAGICEPSNDFSDATRTKYHEYLDKRGAIVKESGCIIDSHCSGDYPMHYVAMRASQLEAHRGFPKKVESLSIDENWEQLLQSFCEIMEIEWSLPSWYLVSDWC